MCGDGHLLRGRLDELDLFGLLLNHDLEHLNDGLLIVGDLNLEHEKLLRVVFADGLLDQVINSIDRLVNAGRHSGDSGINFIPVDSLAVGARELPPLDVGNGLGRTVDLLRKTVPVSCILDLLNGLVNSLIELSRALRGAVNSLVDLGDTSVEMVVSDFSVLSQGVPVNHLLDVGSLDLVSDKVPVEVGHLRGVNRVLVLNELLLDSGDQIGGSVVEPIDGRSDLGVQVVSGLDERAVKELLGVGEGLAREVQKLVHALLAHFSPLLEFRGHSGGSQHSDSNRLHQSLVFGLNNNYNYSLQNSSTPVLIL